MDHWPENRALVRACTLKLASCHLELGETTECKRRCNYMLSVNAYEWEALACRGQVRAANGCISPTLILRLFKSKSKSITNVPGFCLYAMCRHQFQTSDLRCGIWNICFASGIARLTGKNHNIPGRSDMYANQLRVFALPFVSP